MKMRRLISLITIFSTLSLHAELNFLHKDDIRKVMNEIFQQHVDKKEMSANILRNSLKSYLDQFDPTRHYLLEQEMTPYLNLTNSQLDQIKKQYQQNDLSIFIEMNKLIEKAILRARAFRKEIESDGNALVRSAKQYIPDDQESQDENFRKMFAKSPDELKKRWQQNILAFIQSESKQFGEGQATHNPARTMAIYESTIRENENTYLGTDEKGDPLPVAENESLFTLHILKALTSNFDAHTKVLNDQEAYNMKVRLEKGFPGIGIVARKSDSKVLVSSITEHTPAERSGQIKVGDEIVAIDGRNTVDEPFDKVLNMIRGKTNNTYVELLLLRNNQPIHLKLKRETIPVNEGRVEYSYETFGNGIIGHITLHMFYQGANNITSENDVRDAIENLRKRGNLRGLVLDLRDNMGGFLTQAVRVAGLFLKSGVVVTSKYFNGDEHIYRNIDDDVFYDGPLVILTSRETASAAEIVAQSLQDYGVGVVVGDEQTFGKGTIQSQTVTTEGEASFFKVTVGKYYTVSGKTPQLQGVKADIVVPSQISGELIGEEFLDNTIQPDTIAPAFTDNLSDMPEGKRSWFLNYYAPKMQHKKKLWQSLVPQLKTNSAYRITHNKNYQTMLKKIVENEIADEEHPTLSPIPQNYGEEDLQLAEATNILKDMILLHSQNRANDLVELEN